MYSKRRRTGFTLVEVVTIIVVIAILAAITVAVFAGIRQRAQSSHAKTNASAVEKIAESYYEQYGRYPATTTEFRALLTRLPDDVTLLTNAQSLSTTNGETSIDYDIVGTAAAASGARIRYWDYQISGGQAIAADVIYLGDASSGSTFVDIVQ